MREEGNVGGLMVIYKKAGSDETQFDLFHRLSDGEYVEYLAAYQRVDKAIGGGLEMYAEEALRQFESCLESIKKFMEEGNLSIIRASAELWQRSIICLALTFAASLNIHQEHGLTRAKRLHGKGSIGFVALKALFNREYDECQGYRISYKLRNLLVHHTIECVGLHLSAREERSPGGIVVGDKYSAIARLRRDQCEETAKEYLNVAIRNELAEMEEDPDLLPLFRDALASIHRVARDGFDVLNPELRKELSKVVELDELFGARTEGRALARFVPIAGTLPRQTSMPHTVLDPKIFSYAKEVLLLHSNSTSG
ncbi:hypothetical protein J5X84_44190 [Streptosporangiaceae bacterium NEAU-GS5]|nr:hypothetical protein [Streptosporangiaceae bacterium NEAU-GS5]